MCNAGRDGIVRMNQIQMLVIKISVTEIKNACDGLIWRLNMVKERISELEDRSIWITQSKTKRGEKNKEGGKKEHPRAMVQY